MGCLLGRVGGSKILKCEIALLLLAAMIDVARNAGVRRVVAGLRTRVAARRSADLMLTSVPGNKLDLWAFCGYNLQRV